MTLQGGGGWGVLRKSVISSGPWHVGGKGPGVY